MELSSVVLTVSSSWHVAAERVQQMTKVASLRTVVLGAPLRVILKHLSTRSVAPDADNLVALMHRPRQSYFLIPQVRTCWLQMMHLTRLNFHARHRASMLIVEVENFYTLCLVLKKLHLCCALQPEKVTVVFPMRYKDANDVVLATSFLQVTVRFFISNIYLTCYNNRAILGCQEILLIVLTSKARIQSSYMCTGWCWQEFMEARRSAGLSTAPPCLWAPTPPLELKGAPAHALDANSGFVSFGTT